MDENPIFFQAFVDVVDCVFDLNDGQAVDCGLFKNAVDSEVRPLSVNVYSLPSNPSFQVPLLIAPLVYEGPTKI